MIIRPLSVRGGGRRTCAEMHAGIGHRQLTNTQGTEAWKCWGDSESRTRAVRNPTTKRRTRYRCIQIYVPFYRYACMCNICYFATIYVYMLFHMIKYLKYTGRLPKFYSVCDHSATLQVWMIFDLWLKYELSSFQDMANSK